MYFHVDYPDLNRLENQASSMITGIHVENNFREINKSKLQINPDIVFYPKES
jgi:hypothetical protein